MDSGENMLTILKRLKLLFRRLLKKKSRDQDGDVDPFNYPLF